MERRRRDLLMFVWAAWLGGLLGWVGCQSARDGAGSAMEAPNRDRVYEPSELVSQPVLRREQDAIGKLMAVRARTLVEYVILPDGRVDPVAHILETDAWDAAQAVRNEIKRLWFVPGRVDDHPVATRIRVQFPLASAVDLLTSAYETRDLDTRPRAIARVAPRWPESVERSASGEVTVEFVVTRAGTPVMLRVVRSTDERFSRATIEAVRQWRFLPTTFRGEPVPIFVRVKIPFLPEKK